MTVLCGRRQKEGLLRSLLAHSISDVGEIPSHLRHGHAFHGRSKLPLSFHFSKDEKISQRRSCFYWTKIPPFLKKMNASQTAYPISQQPSPPPLSQSLAVPGIPSGFSPQASALVPQLQVIRTQIANAQGQKKSILQTLETLDQLLLRLQGAHDAMMSAIMTLSSSNTSS
jgi:hypothetical protein